MEKEFVRSDWFKAIGGILFLIGALMPWWEFEFADGGVGGGLGGSKNVFDYWMTGILPFIIFTGIALLTIIIRTDSLPLPAWLVHPVLQLSLAVIGAVLVGVRFLWSAGYACGSSPLVDPPRQARHETRNHRSLFGCEERDGRSLVDVRGARRTFAG